MNTARFEAQVHYQEGHLSLEAGTRTSSTVSLIGYWSALLTAAFSVSFGLAVIVTLIASLSSLPSANAQGWTGIEGFMSTFQPVRRKT